jgi:hypothetical protein
MKTKITALIIAAVLILSLGACADTRYALTVGGAEIRAGEYIYLQLTASQEAAEKFMDLNPDVNIYEDGFNFFAQTIEGVSFGDWINSRAVEHLTEMAVIAALFDELGLEIPAEDELMARRNVEAMWASTEARSSFGLDYDTLGEFYEEIGISKDSVALVILNNRKEEMVFFAIFGEDGTQAVSQEEIGAYFEENFVRFRVLRMSFEGLDDAQVIELENMADDFVNRLNAGESFFAIIYEYDDYMTAIENAFDIWDDDGQLTIDNEQWTIDDEYIDDDEIIEEEIIEEETIEEVIEEAVDHESLNDLDRLEKIGVPSVLPEYVQEFLLTIPMNTADMYDDLDDIYILVPLPILEREDWLEWYFESLLLELKGDEMSEIIAAGMSTVDVVLNDAAIRRYKPETAARRFLQPWL